MSISPVPGYAGSVTVRPPSAYGESDQQVFLFSPAFCPKAVETLIMIRKS